MKLNTSDLIIIRTALDVLIAHGDEHAAGLRRAGWAEVAIQLQAQLANSADMLQRVEQAILAEEGRP